MTDSNSFVANPLSLLFYVLRRPPDSDSDSDTDSAFSFSFLMQISQCLACFT